MACSFGKRVAGVAVECCQVILLYAGLEGVVFGGGLITSSLVIGEAGQISFAFTVVHFTRGSQCAFQASIYIFSASLGWLCVFL